MRDRGFTLVELVIVIVLLAVVATISVRFVALSTQGAIDTSARQQRALKAAVISEQVSRALRGALPTSVRTNGNCIEWMPIVAGSNYLNRPKGGNSFDAVPLPGSASASGRAVLYPHSGNVYQPSDPGVISPPASMAGDGTVTFDGGQTHRFKGQSPQRRFYLVASPRMVCQEPGSRFLYRYRNYGIQSGIGDSKPLTMPNREVLAAGVQTGSLAFELTPPSLQRGAVVSFDYTLADPDSGETLDVGQEVQIRNVP
ncbi:MSHA biogenesis protein MshO [Tamilnaduibacter salinus]|uniref:MSHA biogenesis protein MshO n=1 Tax=Tamilnaduibacter salinus TaxID=1484056 RepID=A0A2U1CU04_9GAMM|nr:prepilin-type N-terminal cleavage/methylation domain-containing protein [Tamilnaduibacter salinus]PVY70322.1 MSHA biogenesis protein MshO [Tamilnaduibacter salinus]